MPWEQIEDDGFDGHTERMEVPGGYLYRTLWNHRSVGAVVFAPHADPIITIDGGPLTLPAESA